MDSSVGSALCESGKSGPTERPPITARFGKIIPNRIFIGGLSADITEADVLDVFSYYGTVKSTKIICDRSGNTKGYGFVTYENIENAQYIKKNVESVLIKNIKIKIYPAIRKQNIVNIPENMKPEKPQSPEASRQPELLALPMSYQQYLPYYPIYHYNLPWTVPFFWPFF